MSNLEEQREAFNKQMNAWSSSQGVFHQFRHTGGGQTVFLKLIKLLSLCAVLVFLAAVATGIHLYTRVGSDGFKADVEKKVARVFNAEEAVISSIRKDKNKALIARLSMTASETSCFTEAKANHIDFKMSPLNGLRGKWDLGVLGFRGLEMNLKSGGGDDQASIDAYQSIFKNYGNLEFKRVEIQDASFSWGYTELDKGSIKGSQLLAFRKGNEWELQFSGGTFSHHWLRDVNIDSLSVLCNESGLKVTEARLSNGDGTLSFKLDVVVSGQPKVTGSFEMNAMPVESLLPEDYKNLIRGAVSGEGDLSGSLNSQNGVLVDADLVFGEEDPLIFFDTIPLLDVLSVVDINRSYHKIVFDKASLSLQVAGKATNYKDVNLSSIDKIDVIGDFSIRPPSHAEIAKSTGFTEVDVKNEIDGDMSFLDGLGSRRATGKASEVDDLHAFKIMRRKSIERELAANRFVGSLKGLLHADAFDKSASLRNAYPVDESSGKIHLDIPFNSSFSTLTKELCEELFSLAKARD